MIYLILAIFYPAFLVWVWCILRSGSEHRKPTPRRAIEDTPQETIDSWIIKAESEWRVR
jgi:hypothetical protein